MAATRDDAENTKLIANVTNCMKDFVSTYTATGQLTDSEKSDACVAVKASTGGSIVNNQNGGNEVNVSLTLKNNKNYSQSATYKGSGIQ
ncbi:hypothetical protein MNB_SV-13-637 [hydrothermal vent metagenome]|uniref:Uncharacterized protein n=1 Tax=hydrothermal vent metagenome TaxID=652676 RepID=A0A1W1CCB0_9ZZZZ